jgi:hypothetical protein
MGVVIVVDVVLLLLQVCMLEGANLQTAAYITPVDEDYTTYTNLQQSLLLRFAIAAVWFFIIGMAQVGRRGWNRNRWNYQCGEVVVVVEAICWWILVLSFSVLLGSPGAACVRCSCLIEQ